MPFPTLQGPRPGCLSMSDDRGHGERRRARVPGKGKRILEYSRKGEESSEGTQPRWRRRGTGVQQVEMREDCNLGVGGAL